MLKKNHPLYQYTSSSDKLGIPTMSNMKFEQLQRDHRNINNSNLPTFEATIDSTINQT